MMRVRSYKHIAPCPACGRLPDDCRGHDWKALARARAAEERRVAQEQIRGTPEWLAANRLKRLALKPTRKGAL